MESVRALSAAVSTHYDFRFFQEHFVRARKPHICDNCARVIQSGETYERNQVWCGIYATLRYCSDCRPTEGRAPLHWGESYGEA
jgi:predicted membrane-bound spermidine synthase